MDGTLLSSELIEVGPERNPSDKEAGLNPKTMGVSPAYRFGLQNCKAEQEKDGLRKVEGRHPL